MRPLTLLAFIIVGFGLAAKGPMDKSRPTGPINITAVVDSALIMADNYADALVDKPEMAPTRLNMLRNFGGEKPAYICDTICSRLYDFFVSYTEQNKTDRATAFKDCYLALARPDSPQLGPLYAAELTIARENTDTTAIKKYLPLLEDYATRLDYDYDEELAAARAFLHKVRNRRPIQEMIAGVWVSEDVAGVTMPDGKKHFLYPEKKKNLVNTMKVIQIRNSKSPVFGTGDKNRSLESFDTTNHIDIIKCREGLSSLTPLGSTSWYIPLYAWELPAYNMKPKSEEYVAKTSHHGGPKFFGGLSGHIEEYLSRFVITDENSYSIYAFWGDERLKRNPAEIGAVVRQSTQSIQASIAGELSRSNYSFTESLAGNLAAELISAGVNALIDTWMVSTDKIWSVEATLHMENPYKLTAVIITQLIISKSNSDKPEVYVSRHTADYYRWEPEDDVFFLGTDFRDYRPWNPNYGPILLHRISKEENKIYDSRRKDFSKEWRERYEKILADKKTKSRLCLKARKKRKMPKRHLKNSSVGHRKFGWTGIVLCLTNSKPNQIITNRTEFYSYEKNNLSSYAVSRRVGRRTGLGIPDGGRHRCM